MTRCTASSPPSPRVTARHDDRSIDGENGSGDSRGGLRSDRPPRTEAEAAGRSPGPDPGRPRASQRRSCPHAHRARAGQRREHAHARRAGDRARTARRRRGHRRRARSAAPGARTGPRTRWRHAQADRGAEPVGWQLAVCGLQSAVGSSQFAVMSKDDGRLVSVEINGMRYPIRSTLDPAYVAELAAYVEQKMNLAAKESPAGDTLKIAVLAALNIADECFRAREEGSVQRTDITQRARELERLLDLALDPEPLARAAGSH